MQPDSRAFGPMVDRLLHLIQRLETLLPAALLLGMIVLAGVQIALRNLFDGGLFWVEPLLRIAVLWLTLLGALAATRGNNHIKIDVISRYLPQLGRRIATWTGTLFSACVCTLIAWHSARFVWVEYQAQTTLFNQLPAWMFQIIMPVGFGLMALRFLLFSYLGGATSNSELRKDA